VLSAATGPVSQSDRNREKQRVRDSWSRQRDGQPTGPEVEGRSFPRPPDSLEPSIWDRSDSNSPSSLRRLTNGGAPSVLVTPGHSQPGASVRVSSEYDLTAAREIRDRLSALPDGMDVKDALASCEDPTLGWSLQFWITIADPVVGPFNLFPR
jgi:hypothetical protein